MKPTPRSVCPCPSYRTQDQQAVLEKLALALGRRRGIALGGTEGAPKLVEMVERLLELYL